MADSGAGIIKSMKLLISPSISSLTIYIEVKVEMAVQHRWSVGATIKSAAETEKPYDMTHLTVLERDSSSQDELNGKSTHGTFKKGYIRGSHTWDLEKGYIRGRDKYLIVKVTNAGSCLA